MTAQQIQPILKNIETPIENRVSSHYSAQKLALLRMQTKWKDHEL